MFNAILSPYKIPSPNLANNTISTAKKPRKKSFDITTYKQIKQREKQEETLEILQ